MDLVMMMMMMVVGVLHSDCATMLSLVVLYCLIEGEDHEASPLAKTTRPSEPD